MVPSAYRPTLFPYIPPYLDVSFGMLGMDESAKVCGSTRQHGTIRIIEGME
jgi:hypothetical protein